jgi:hypothetical protein
MGFWLKSFNAKPPPVPGTSFSVPDINYRESRPTKTANSVNVNLISSASCHDGYLRWCRFDLGLAFRCVSWGALAIHLCWRGPYCKLEILCIIMPILGRWLTNVI